MATIAVDGADRDRAGTDAARDVWIGAAAALLVLAVECGLWFAVHRRALGLVPALGLHALLVVFIAAIAARGRGTSRSPLLVLLALTTATLGPVGAAGTLLTWVVRQLTKRQATTFNEWYQSLFPEEEEIDELESVERMAESVITGGGRVSIGPLLDVLSHGTRAQKQVALGVFTRKFHPAFAPALHKALRDGDSAIRVQAATSMTMIENNFLKRATELEQAVTERADSPERIKALARHHDDYAHTGVLDPLRERRSRTVALRSYLKYLRLNPGDAEARLAAARLLYHRRRYAIAAAWLEQCIRDGLFTINMAPWYMDCLYKLRRYRELRAFARQHAADLSRLDVFPIRVMETARLWASGGAGEPGRGP